MPERRSEVQGVNFRPHRFHQIHLTGDSIDPQWDNRRKSPMAKRSKLLTILALIAADPRHRRDYVGKRCREPWAGRGIPLSCATGRRAAGSLSDQAERVIHPVCNHK